MTEELKAVTYARELYELFDQSAKEEIMGAKRYMVWRGKLTEMYNKVGAPSKYYSLIRLVLVKTGSITIAEAGSRNRPSVVVLNHPVPPPDDEIFSSEVLTPAQPRARLVADMERRLSALEAWRETQGGINIAEVLRNFEERLVRLESQGNTQ